MVFYLCGLKCRSSSDPAELPRNSRGLTSPSQPHAAALTLTFWTKHLSIIISQVSMTSLKANELWGVKVKLSSFFALCGYQSSICSAALWPNMENDAEFYKKNSDTSYQQLCLGPKMSGHLGVFSYSGRFKYWSSWIFKRKRCVKIKYCIKEL